MNKMRKISIRIRRVYFDDIKDGPKKIEYRSDTPYWRARLGYPKAYTSERMPKIAVFICGKDIHRRRIINVYRILSPEFSPQGQKDVPTPYCYAIYLGDVIE